MYAETCAQALYGSKGAYIWAITSPLLDTDGNIVGAIESIRDISDQKRAEKSLKESEEKFRSYVENAPEGIFITDEKGNYVDVNDAACKVTGYSREELLKMNLIDLIPLEDRENATKSFASVVETGKSSVEVSFVKKGGEKRYWIVSAVKLSEDSYLGFTKEITDRRIAEENLKESENTLRGIFNATPIGICLLVNRKIIWANDSAYKMLGYQYGSLTNEDTLKLYENEEENKRAGSVIYGGLKEKDVADTVTKLKRNDGSFMDCYMRASPLDKAELSKGVIVTLTDLTAKLKSEKQLDENLEYFAHLVDHIRNPLAIISGFTQVKVENEATRDRLLRQIDRIEEIIKQLDKGWMDTEDTRRFLKNYM